MQALLPLAGLASHFCRSLSSHCTKLTQRWNGNRHASLVELTVQRRHLASELQEVVQRIFDEQIAYGTSIPGGFPCGDCKWKEAVELTGPGNLRESRTEGETLARHSNLVRLDAQLGHKHPSRDRPVLGQPLLLLTPVAREADDFGGYGRGQVPFGQALGETRISVGLKLEDRLGQVENLCLLDWLVVADSPVVQGGGSYDALTG